MIPSDGSAQNATVTSGVLEWNQVLTRKPTATIQETVCRAGVVKQQGLSPTRIKPIDGGARIAAETTTR